MSVILSGKMSLDVFEVKCLTEICDLCGDGKVLFQRGE